MSRILFLFIVAAATVPVLLAQKKTSPESIKLDIVLTPSRNQFTAGGPVGITGTLTNTSGDSTVYVTEQSVTLMQPPELQGPAGQLGWPAFFPTEHAGSGAASLSPDSVVLALKPGHGVTVQWAPRAIKDNADDPFLKRFQDWGHNLLRFLSFTPGDYPISVQAKYWSNPALPRLDYRTADRTVSLHVLAPQSVILFGAAIGGLIAYLIFPSRRTQQLVRSKTADSKTQVTRVWRSVITVGKQASAAAGAMLWSAIVAILLSRLSETEFLIRVSVADFWGAIATGFVAQYAGSRWLEWLVRPRETGQDKAATPATETTAERRAGPRQGAGTTADLGAVDGRSPADEIGVPDLEAEATTSGQR